MGATAKTQVTAPWSKSALVVVLAAVGLTAGRAALPAGEARAEGAKPPMNIVPQQRRVKLARAVDPNKQLTFKNRTMTAREFIEQVPGDEVIDLPDGTRAKVQELIDAFHDLRTRAGGSFAAIPKSRAFESARADELRQGASRTLAATRAPQAFTAERWNPLPAPPPQVPVRGPRVPERQNDDKEGPDLWSPPEGAPPSDELGNGTWVTNQAPFAKNWEIPWGSPDRFGGYETLGLGGGYAPNGSNPAVWCAEGVESGLYILGKRTPVLKFRQVATGAASGGSAEAGLFLFNSPTPVWSRSGNYSISNWSQTLINRPVAEGVLPIYPPFGAHWKALASGSIGLSNARLSAARQGNKVSCAVASTPSIRLELSVTATPAIVGTPPQGWSLIEKYVVAGFRGKLTLVDGRLPTSDSLTLTIDPAKENAPLKLTEAASMSWHATLLSGSITAFVGVNPPSWLTWVLDLIGEAPFQAEWELHSWQGLSFGETIASVPAHDIGFKKQ